GTKGEIDSDCIKKLDAYSHYKKQMIRVIQNSRDTKEIDEALKSLRDETKELSDQLIGYEMQLVEQFEDVIKEFERNYTELCSGINEYGQTCFARLRELENEHHEKFSEIVLQAFDRFSKGDIDDVDDELRDVLSDKDTLVNAINGSHDFHLSKFDHQEDNLVSGINKVLETLTQKLHDDEIQRNRDRICEIITFIDRCNAEIDLAEENAY
ncbi:Dynein regulatory complex subunit 3, partial [Blyttiomyces sp. JEL0837]